MKVSVPKQETSGQSTKVALLPLTDNPALYELGKHNSVKCELRSVPTQADSAKYSFQLRILAGTESARTILRWKTAVNQVFTGLNLTDFDTKKPIMETAMRAPALSLFHTSLEAQAIVRREVAAENARVASEAAGASAADQATARDAVLAQGLDRHRHVDQLDAALEFILSSLLPKNILSRVKRSLRRETRKPKDMTVRAYYQHLLRVNYEELPLLPPFKPNQQLTTDEILDILLCGTPKSWQREMERQGFDPMEKDIGSVVSFMENLEATDDFEATAKKSSASGKKSGSKSNNNSNSNSNGGSKELHCVLHGKGNHASEDCHKLKDSVKKLKAGPSSGSKGKSDDKKSNWKAKADAAASSGKKDLAALIKEAVSTATKSDKKRQQQL